MSDYTCKHNVSLNSGCGECSKQELRVELAASERALAEAKAELQVRSDRCDRWAADLSDERAAHERTRAELVDCAARLTHTEGLGRVRLGALEQTQARVAELEQSEVDSLEIIGKLAARVAELEQRIELNIDALGRKAVGRTAAESALASARKLQRELAASSGYDDETRRIFHGIARRLEEALSTTPTPAPSEPTTDALIYRASCRLCGEALNRQTGAHLAETDCPC